MFLDDALIHGGTFEEHLGFIWSFLYAMEEQGLHLSAPKTQFMRDRCNYLGHVLSADGVADEPKRVAALREWPVPKSATDVRAFLGFCLYLRSHIEGFCGAPLGPYNQDGSVQLGPHRTEIVRDPAGHLLLA